MANSALESLNNVTANSTPMSFDDFFTDRTGIKESPYSIGNRFINFFTGRTSSAEQAYQNYLSEYEARKNQAYTAAQNKITHEREDTAVQRAFQDYLKAGVNPYSLVVNGSLGNVTSASQAAAPTYKAISSKEKTNKSTSSLLGSALKILAILALK